MPGLAGFFTRRPREWAEPRLHKMVKAACHESFYETGTFIDESIGLYVGWSALKGSFAAGMPVCNERGSLVLVFSGEDFPEPGTARDLKQRGHEFKTPGPSYLVHLAEEEGTFPAKLNGRFHGILIDRMQQTALLFNDRFGMHQVYYHEAKDSFYFASEAKSILAVLPELRRLDPRGLGEFVACGCVLEQRTLFENIQLLPPAAAWLFRNAVAERKETYFDVREWEGQGSADPEAYYRELRAVFERNLPRYLNGQQPLAMSLTGGLDTRMIMAWQKLAPGSLPCYTFGGTYRDCRDVTVARQVARVCQQPHRVITTGKEFLSDFPRYAERSVYLTDGGVDMSRTPALYVNEKAREIAPVRIAGIYGSEVLRWLPGFKPVEPAAGLFRPELLSQVHLANQTYAELLQGHPISFVLFRQAPQRGVNTLEESQLTVRSPYLDNDFVRTAFRAPAPGFASSDVFSKKEVSLRLIGDGNEALRRIRTDRGLAGDGSRASAALARACLEFTFKAEYAYDYGMPQTVARVDHALSALRLERLFLGRHKFYHFRVWYRDQLSSYVREMLLDRRTLSRPFLNRQRVETIVEGHLRGDRNYTTEIHKVLTLELIHRLFADPA